MVYRIMVDPTVALPYVLPVVCLTVAERKIAAERNMVEHGDRWWFGCHEFYFPRHIGNNNHSNWRTHIFQRGGLTTNQMNVYHSQTWVVNMAFLYPHGGPHKLEQGSPIIVAIHYDLLWQWDMFFFSSCLHPAQFLSFRCWSGWSLQIYQVSCG